MVHDEIRQYMRENHIKIKSTAEKIGMPPKTRYGMLSGRQRIPAETLRDICCALNVGAEKFVK